MSRFFRTSNGKVIWRADEDGTVHSILTSAPGKWSKHPKDGWTLELLVTFRTEITEAEATAMLERPPARLPRLAVGDVIQVDPQAKEFGGCLMRVTEIRTERMDFVAEMCIGYGQFNEKVFRLDAVGVSIERIGRAVWGR